MKILVAGVGNELRRDDGVGAAVVSRIVEMELDKELNIRAQNFGQNLNALLLALRDCHAAVIVDAVEGSGNPGDIYVIELSDIETGKPEVFDFHDADLRKFIELGKSLGVLPETMYIVGCHPRDLSYGIGLSKETAEKINSILEVIAEIIKKIYKKFDQ